MTASLFLLACMYLQILFELMISIANIERLHSVNRGRSDQQVPWYIFVALFINGLARDCWKRYRAMAQSVTQTALSAQQQLLYGSRPACRSVSAALKAEGQVKSRCGSSVTTTYFVLSGMPSNAPMEGRCRSWILEWLLRYMRPSLLFRLQTHHVSLHCRLPLPQQVALRGLAERWCHATRRHS